jgi:vitamin B12 transporter
MGGGESIPNSAAAGKSAYFLSTGWNFDENNRLGIVFSGSKLEEGGKGMSAFGRTASTVEAFRGKPYGEIQWKHLDSADLVYEGKTPSSKYNWLVRYFYAGSSFKYNRRVPGMEALGFPEEFFVSKSAFKHQGSQAQLAYSGDVLSLIGGVDYLLYKMRQLQAMPLYTTNDTRSDASSVFTNYGVFLLGKLSLLPEKNLVISGGARYDTYSIDIDSQVRDEIKPKETRKYDRIIPSFGIAYSPVPMLKLRANYGDGYHVPTPRNLIGNFYAVTTLFIGNKDLKPEESTTIEFGFDTEFNHIVLSGTYYTTKYKNFIGTQRIPDVGTMYINIPDITINGIETSVKANLGHIFGQDYDLVPYIYYNRLFKFEDKQKNKLAAVNKDSFSAGLNFGSKNLGLYADIRGTYYGIPEIDTFSDQSKPERKGGATVWSLSLSKDLYDFGDNGSVKLKVSANNVFDKVYESTIDLYGAGRSFYVGLSYEL